jgi:hypothetical protein
LSVKKEWERELYKHRSSHGNTAFSFSDATTLVSLGDSIKSLSVKKKVGGGRELYFINVKITMATLLSYSSKQQ